VLAGAAGTAYAVNEIFGELREIVVDDVSDIVDVDAARGDVRGDEDVIAALLKASERRGALGL